MWRQWILISGWTTAILCDAGKTGWRSCFPILSLTSDSTELALCNRKSECNIHSSYVVLYIITLLLYFYIFILLYFSPQYDCLGSSPHMTPHAECVVQHWNTILCTLFPDANCTVLLNLRWRGCYFYYLPIVPNSPQMQWCILRSLWLFLCRCFVSCQLYIYLYIHIYAYHCFIFCVSHNGRCDPEIREPPSIKHWRSSSL